AGQGDTRPFRRPAHRHRTIGGKLCRQRLAIREDSQARLMALFSVPDWLPPERLQIMRMRVSASGPKLNQAALSCAASTMNSVSVLPSFWTRAVRMVLIEASLERTQAYCPNCCATPSEK